MEPIIGFIDWEITIELCHKIGHFLFDTNIKLILINLAEFAKEFACVYTHEHNHPSREPSIQFVNIFLKNLLSRN